MVEKSCRWDLVQLEIYPSSEISIIFIYEKTRWPTSIPLNYQHILVWGALHTVVPIALALSLLAQLPFASQLRTIVFGVVILKIIMQGLSIPYVLKWTDVT